MKTLKYLSIVLVSILTFSCSSDNDTNPTNINELSNLTKIQELSNPTHTIELYSKNGILEQGYNAITLRIKENSSGDFATDASLSWNPMMYMAAMQHSCPKSDIVKLQENKHFTTDISFFRWLHTELNIGS